MHHTQSRFPFPRGASFLYPRDASRLVGWDGAGGRASSSRSHHTHNHTRGFCAPRALPSQLEPNRVGGRPGETSTTAADDRRRNEQQTRTKQTDTSSRSSGGKSAGSNGRTTGSAATEQNTDRQTDRHSERQQRQNRSGRRKNRNPSTANDSAGVDGGRRQTRAATDTPLGVYCTRRKERHRPQPGWHAGHTFTRLT